jgi:hypothetical protein
MNPTKALLILLIVASSFIFPAAAISYAHAASATVMINQPNAKTFKCIDPTGKKLLCILVVTKVKPPKNTLTCKDPDNHRFKCTYIIINKKEINTRVFHKIVFLYVYVTPKYKKLLFENKSMVVPIFVTKTVVKIIHEHEYSGGVRVVVIREEEDYDRPTAIAINCFAPCFQQEYTRAIIHKTIINAPVFVTNVNQITSIVNNVNTVNSVNLIDNNLINNAYVNNVNTNNMNIFNPPPPPAYSPTNLFSVPPGTPIYKGGTTNPNAPPNMIGSSPTGPTNELTPTQTQTNQTLLNLPGNTTTTSQPSDTPPFNNSNTSSPVNNTITPPPPPSASNTTPNNTTSSGTLENNTTSNLSAASNSQAVTPGCGQGTDNSTCQSNSNPTSTAQQNTTTTSQPSDTPPFNNSNTSSPVNNTITPPPPPSASNTTPNNTTSSGTLENNTTSNLSAASNSQAVTPGCGQGTDNSTCQSNQTPQNATTTPHAVDCNANPDDPSCLQQNANNNPN